ncbi:MAG: glycosyltransferase family 2 protein [Cyanobacteriota bacterium]|jgi:glycosyltransferase involved in cell wall biosynthesis
MKLKEQRGRVSIIIPVYNRSRQLKEAVMTVLLQTYTNIEIVIVDDGSSDDTIIITEAISKKWGRTITLLRQENSGPGPARQLGTENSCGEFIQYLDSDDLMIPNKVCSQVLAFRKDFLAGICYGMSYQKDYSYDPPLEFGPIRSTGNKVLLLFPKLLNERWWTTSSPIYRRSLVEQIGPWMNLINEEDWEFDSRAGATQTHLTWVSLNVSIRRINLSKDHLSSGGSTNPKKLRDRIISKHRLYRCALATGIKNNSPEMKKFARECFLLARQCAIAGLAKESESIFSLAKQCTGFLRRLGPDYLIYQILGSILGWNQTGKLSTRLRDMVKLR